MITAIEKQVLGAFNSPLECSPEREARATVPSDIRQFPYVQLIRESLQKEQISRAKKLLALALKQPGEPEPALLSLQKVLAPPKVRSVPKQDVDRSGEFQWLVEHSREYAGRWVALVGRKLLATAGSLKELMVLVKSSSPEATPLVHRFNDADSADSAG